MKRANQTNTLTLGKVLVLRFAYHPLREEVMHPQTRRNLWALLIFLLASIFALPMRHVQFLELFPVEAHWLLGAPPPIFLVTVAMFVYVFATLVLVGYRLQGGQPPNWKYRDLALRLVFYALYLFAGGLDSHFYGVLIASLLLFALEQFHGLCYTHEGLCGLRA